MNLSGFPDIPDAPRTTKKQPSKQPSKESLQDGSVMKTEKLAGSEVKQPTKPTKKTKPEKKTRLSIVLDIREHDLYAAIQRLDTDIAIHYRVMPIGDMAIYSHCNDAAKLGQVGEGPPPDTDSTDGAENGIESASPDTINAAEQGTLLQIYERKTVADLLASILDGRYKEQSFRMLSSVTLPPHNMVYIVEGSLPRSAVERQRVLSAMTSIHYFKHMSLLRSQTVEETAEILVRTAEKMERELNESVSAAAAQAELSYVGGAMTTTNMVKNRNITPENIGEIILSTIPGVSNITAHAVMQQFGTFRGLMEYLLQGDIEGEEDTLAQIRIGCVDGVKGRKIGKNCVANIRRFLLGK